MKVIVAGGSGFIGRALVARLAASDYEVVVLSRSSTEIEGARTVLWDGVNADPWSAELEGAAAVVNLVGETVLRRWNLAGRQKILHSRTQPTTAIGLAILNLSNPPTVWINGSAVGYYGDRGDDILTEESGVGTGFLSDACDAWEESQRSCARVGVRLVQLRTGLPLSSEGGLLPLLSKLTRWFLGSALGSGRQWMPWIHMDDLVASFVWCIENEVAGPVNGVGPNPVRNAEFMARMREAVGRPWVPPVPKPVLQIAHLFGAPPTEAALMSSRVVPTVLQESGFEFQFPSLEAALKQELGKQDRSSGDRSTS